MRTALWMKLRNEPWADISPVDQITVIDPKKPYFIQNMTNFSQVTTVFLRFADINPGSFWNSLADYSNLLVQKYYKWAGDPLFCKLFVDRRVVNKRWTWVPFCSSKKQSILSPKSLNVEFLNPVNYMSRHSFSNPSIFYRPPPYVTYLSMVQDAVLTETGSVISKNVKIYPNSRKEKEDQVVPEKYLESPLYSEVLSIAQFFGFAVYHNNVEIIPRVMPYIEFLVRHPDIKLHVGETRSHFTAFILGIVGIPEDRIITGVVRAKVVYLPEGTTSGFVHILNTQLLSHKYRSYIKNVLGQQDRRSVVVVRRTWSRYFSNITKVENMVENITKKYGLKFEIFSDDPVPSILESMKMFNRAVLVFAPHGAGLFNIVFSEPGTFVLETVCSYKEANGCYLRLAHALGHRYYGNMAISRTCLKGMDVDFESMKNAVEFYMPYAVKLANGEI